MCSDAEAMRGCSASSRSARPVAPAVAQRMNSSTAASNDSVRASTSSRSAFQDGNPCDYPATVQLLLDAGEQVRPHYLPTGLDDVDALLRAHVDQRGKQP